MSIWLLLKSWILFANLVVPFEVMQELHAYEQYGRLYTKMKHQVRRFWRCLQKGTMTVPSRCLLVCCCDSLSNRHMQLSPDKCWSYSVGLTNTQTDKEAESETGGSAFAWEQCGERSFPSVISWQIRFFSSQVFGPCCWVVFWLKAGPSCQSD